MSRQSVRFALNALILSLLALWLTSPTQSTAQNGSISGVVKDEHGLVITDAGVVVINQGTEAKYQASTSSIGTYQVLHIPAGVYRVEISKTGFQTEILRDLKVDAGSEYSVPPVIMAVGTTNVTVEVSAGEELVQTTSATVNSTVEKNQIEELPLLDRNPLGVTLLQAGVSSSSTTNTAINGQRTSFTNVTLDGINIQDNFIRANGIDFTPNQLFLGQVSEVSITNQNGTSDSGLGSSQINYTTPSGSNQWHGELFWFHRNSAVAANDWFNNHTGTPRPHFLLNQAGGNIGGPVLHDKLFVYGAYELYDTPSHAPALNTILLPGAANGTFRYHTDCGTPNTAPCPVGVSNGQLVTTNILTMGCNNAAYLCSVDPAIAAQIAQLPTTSNDSSAGDGLNTGGYRFNRQNTNRLDNSSVRLDYTMNDHNAFGSSFTYNRQFFDRPDVDNMFTIVPIVVNRDTTKFLSAFWRWSPHASFTNEARFGFNLAPADFKGGVNTSQTPYVIENQIYSSPNPTFFFQGRHTKTYTWQDNAGWIHGNHTISFGVLSQRIAIRTVGEDSTVPIWRLGFSSGDPNKLIDNNFACPTCSGDIGSNDLATANNLLATLAGNIGEVDQTFNATSHTSGFVNRAPHIENLSINNYSFYGSDAWKLRRNLTLTLGMRWEYVGRFNEKNGLILGPIVPSGQTAGQAMLSNANVNFIGGSGQPVYAKDLDNFAPQAGIAWDPWGKGKSAFRAGFSMHYVNDEAIRAADNATSIMPGIQTSYSNTNLSGNTVSGNPPVVPAQPFQIPYTFQNQWLQSCNLASGTTTVDFADCFGALGNTNFGFLVNPKLETPYVEDWNVSFQHDLGWGTSLTLGYLGNRALRLYKGVDYNQVDIINNGILPDFLRARHNGFLSEAAGQGFNPDYNPAIPGSQQLPVFNTVEGTDIGCDPALLACFFSGLVQTGEVGELVHEEHAFFVEGANGQIFPWTPNPYILGGDVLTNAAYSNWNAGVIEIRRRSRHGLYLQANYTYSKVMTNGDGSGQTRFDPFLDNAQPRLDRRRADIDLTHIFKTNFLYELPFGRGHDLHFANAAANKVVSGWNIGTIMTWQSGPPFSILSNRGTLNRGGRSSGRNTAVSTLTATQLATQIGVHHNGSTVYSINPSFIGGDGRAVGPDQESCIPLPSGVFCNPQPGAVGNLARNSFSAPVFFDWDFSLSKRTNITESKYLEFKAEFFNLPNHATFQVTDQDVNSPTFGVVNSTGTAARRIQFGLRLVM